MLIPHFTGAAKERLVRVAAQAVLQQPQAFASKTPATQSPPAQRPTYQNRQMPANTKAAMRKR